MATCGTVTIEELMATRPDICLKLKSEAKSLADKKPGESEFIQKVKEQVEALFQSTESDLNLEELATDDDYEKKLDDMFDNITIKVQAIKHVSKNAMKNLNPGDRNKLMKFLKAVGKFLSDVLDWLGNLFKYVLEKIRQGFKIVKDAVSGVFNTVYEFLREIF